MPDHAPLTAADLVVLLDATRSMMDIGGWSLVGFDYSKDVVQGVINRTLAYLNTIPVTVDV